MATEQTITISGTPTVVSGVTVPYTLSSDLEIYIGKGLVEKVVLNNAGAGYATVSNAALEFSGGGGSSAALTVDVANGQVSLDNAGVPTNKGTGYTTSPIVGFGNLTSGTGASATAEIYAKKTSGTDYTLSGSSGSTTITFTSALADGDKVLIKRVTDVTTAANTFTAGSSITAADLNKSFNQIRYKTEELPNVTSTALTNGDKGDITVSGSTWTIDNNAVNSAKLANNIDIAGTFDVTGVTTLDSTLGVAGDFSVNTNKFTVAGSDGDTTIAGTLDVTGTSNFGKVTIGDAKYTDGAISDNYLEVGTSGNGLRIWTNKNGYEGGGNDDTYISEIGNGSLAIATNGSNLYLQKNTSGSEAFINCIADGAVRIFYDQGVHTDPKFATTATGVSITGQVDLTTDINVNTDKFNVAGATGNTTIAGTLTTAAQKAVTLPGPVVFGPGSELTVGTDESITVTGSYHTLVTHDTANSDLITINSNPAAVKGQFLILEADSISYTIACKETGNMKIHASVLNIGASAAQKDIISFIYDGEKWCQIAFSQDN